MWHLHAWPTGHFRPDLYYIEIWIIRCGNIHQQCQNCTRQDIKYQPYRWIILNSIAARGQDLGPPTGCCSVPPLPAGSGQWIAGGACGCAGNMLTLLSDHWSVLKGRRPRLGAADNQARLMSPSSQQTSLFTDHTNVDTPAGWKIWPAVSRGLNRLGEVNNTARNWPVVTGLSPDNAVCVMVKPVGVLRQTPVCRPVCSPF